MEWTRKLAGTEYFIVDVQEDSLVIYTSANGPAEPAGQFTDKLGPMMLPGQKQSAGIFRQERGVHAHVPGSRWRMKKASTRRGTLVLPRKNRRLDFAGGGRTPGKTPHKFLPHLCKESFFDLM